MKNIGLTGGIGSGKSTVLRIFSILGVPCYIADVRSKELLDQNDLLKEKLIETFGPIYKGSKIDRKAFANIIFKDESKRKFANQLIHPFVREDYTTWLSKQNAAYVIQEAAILFETGANKLFDQTILTTAPEDLRIQRIVKRDSISIDEIRDRLASQWKDDQKEFLADHVIINDEKNSLIKQVVKIHHQLIG